MHGSLKSISDLILTEKRLLIDIQLESVLTLSVQCHIPQLRTIFGIWTTEVLL